MSFRVEIDALVLLKIQKHCRETLPLQSTGVLLGFDVTKEETVLQVTNCFATLSDVNEEGIDAEEIKKYQDQMILQMTNSKLDGNVVGWYSCRTGDSYLSDISLLEAQYDYQKNIAQSIVIVYDPTAYAHGKVPFKVLQITPEFMAFRTASIEARLPLDLSTWPAGQAFLQEVQYDVSNSVLVDAFVINNLLKERTEVDHVRERMNEARVESAATFLSQQLSAVSQQLEAIDAEQKSIVGVAKRAAQSGGRDLKRHRDELAFECGTTSLQAMATAHQTQHRAEELKAAAVTAKQCLAKLN